MAENRITVRIERGERERLDEIAATVGTTASTLMREAAIRYAEAAARDLATGRPRPSTPSPQKATDPRLDVVQLIHKATGMSLDQVSRRMQVGLVKIGDDELRDRFARASDIAAGGLTVGDRVIAKPSA